MAVKVKLAIMTYGNEDKELPAKNFIPLFEAMVSGGALTGECAEDFLVASDWRKRYTQQQAEPPNIEGRGLAKPLLILVILIEPPLF